MPVVLDRAPADPLGEDAAARLAVVVVVEFEGLAATFQDDRRAAGCAAT